MFCFYWFCQPNQMISFKNFSLTQFFMHPEIVCYKLWWSRTLYLLWIQIKNSKHQKWLLKNNHSCYFDRTNLLIITKQCMAVEEILVCSYQWICFVQNVTCVDHCLLLLTFNYYRSCLLLFVLLVALHGKNFTYMW